MRGGVRPLWGKSHLTWMREVKDIILGGGEHARWEYVREVRMCTWGGHEVTLSGGGVREVRICTWGENVYARWECVHEVTLNGGGGHTRWEYALEVTLNGGGATLCRGPKVTSCPQEVTLGSGGDNSTETLQVTSRPCEVTFLYSIDDTSMMTKLRMMKIPRVWAYIVQSHLTWGCEMTLRSKSSCVPMRGDFSVQ